MLGCYWAVCSKFQKTAKYAGNWDPNPKALVVSIATWI
jgi:hypothetical protein